MWKSLHRFASLGLKSRITARWRSFPGKTCSDSQIDPLKSGIAAAVGQWLSAGGLFFFTAAKIRIGRGPRRRDGRCRRYHSPLRQRRLESDAENRCSREVVSVRNLLILKFIPLQSEMTTLFSCLTSKAPDCELAIWGLDNNQR